MILDPFTVLIAKSHLIATAGPTYTLDRWTETDLL